jgi:hypothetical protein
MLRYWAVMLGFVVLGAFIAGWNEAVGTLVALSGLVFAYLAVRRAT